MCQDGCLGLKEALIGKAWVCPCLLNLGAYAYLINVLHPLPKPTFLAMEFRNFLHSLELSRLLQLWDIEMIEHFDQNVFITTEIGFFRFTSTWSTTRIPLSSATSYGSCSSSQSTLSSPGLASSSSTAPSTSTATHSGTAMRVRNKDKWLAFVIGTFPTSTFYSTG